MSCEYTCDGCGKKAPAEFYPTNPTQYFKPAEWFERGDEDGIQTACSRKCIQRVSKKTGKTQVVLPI